MAKPVVAIVGRPNVGKSTLFNRLIGERRAIVEDVPGTTRDRLYGDTDWNGREFIVIDTAGLEIAGESELEQHIRDQVDQAIREADVIVFLTDVRSGITGADEEVTDLLRRSTKPVVLAVNKSEGPKHPMDAVEFYQLGVGDPVPISALNGQGIGDMLDEVVARLPALVESEAIDASVARIAIIGRPNVGKSALLNRLLGFERSVVSEVPGTTRDTIDSMITVDGRSVLLVDTAGIRRRGKVQRGIEKYSVIRALRAINRADVVLLLIDAGEGPTAQDAHVASYADEAHKGFVIVVNKWDLVEKGEHTVEEYARKVRFDLKFLHEPPVLFISALTGQRVSKVLPTALQVFEARQLRVPTGQLNQVLTRAQFEHPPGSVRGRRLKIYYATQAEVNPPLFVLFVNDPKLLHFSYERYLDNQIRAAFGFQGTPVRLVFRKRESNEQNE